MTPDSLQSELVGSRMEPHERPQFQLNSFNLLPILCFWKGFMTSCPTIAIGAMGKR